ncbi:MAG: AraC family transcriptional regulator [Clostridiaceae bacterium]|nr:AraC family transcriptional regulator [Clostridiaceae bacterium]
MNSRVPITITETSELTVLHTGMEQCAPAHAFGPAVRDYYLIHFILSGKGFFQCEGRTDELAAGQGFLICPDKVAYYQADTQDPWRYVWIGFKGSKAAYYLRRAGLSPQAPIIGAPGLADDQTSVLTLSGCFRQIAADSGLRNGRDLRLLAWLQLMLSILTEQNAGGSPEEDQTGRCAEYVRQACDFMEMNYARKITVGELAGHIGLDRSYFGLLFRRSTGLPPQQYLLRLRMEKACSLMTRSRLPVAAIAHAVGYEDPLLFSRMFRQTVGCPPSQYRHLQEQRKHAQNACSII